MVKFSSVMNILFFSRLFYPHIGGVEKHVYQLSKILIKKGHTVTVVSEQDSSREKLSEIINGINALRIPNLQDGWLKKFKIWKWLFRNYNIINNADIVHCHDVFFWYLPFRTLFPFKKIFTTFHGYEDYPLKRKDIFIHKVSEKLSNGNICIGDFIKKWYGTRPTYVTYGAVGISNIKSQISNKVKNDSAVFIGRLDEQTGIKTYVEAVKIMKKKIPDFKFEIIGDGKFRNKVEKDFKVLGFKNNPEKYFAKCSFAFVSRYLSILEAMAAKRLVFAVYDNPIKEDYLKLTPFSQHIVICGSTLELISKLIFYLKNSKEKDKMIKGAYNWAEDNSWEKLADGYLKLWGGNE